MIGRLNHVAMAVPDLAAAARTINPRVAGSRRGAAAGLARARRHPMVFIHGWRNTKVELIIPLGQKTRRSAAFLDKHPTAACTMSASRSPTSGLRRVAAARPPAQRARAWGEPKTGAHGLPVVFLHPKDLSGTLVELEEVAEAGAPP